MPVSRWLVRHCPGMARRRIGKAIGARTARKLIRELGGAPAPDLLADLERLVPGFTALSSEVVRLNDGQVVHLFLESANLFPSADAFRQLMEDVHRRASQPAGHPLGTAFPNGAGFIAAVPALVAELPGKLGIPADALDGSVDGLEKLDRAARRLGGQECLDNPTILAPLV